METRKRIVVIDDNANDAEVTRRFLMRHGHDAVTAHSGEEGLRVARQVLPDAVVVDYRMPGMNGFEVTRQMKADAELKTIPILMLTGSDSAQNVVEGLGVGADDFVSKGAEVEVVVARLNALLRVKEYQDRLRRMNHQMRRDLDIARRVQEALVPQSPFVSPHLEIRSSYMPSETLSGDFYDYFATGDLSYLFVADVSGHGLPAAILVSLLKSYIHTEVAASPTLASFMSGLNDFLFSVSLPAQFATAALFRIGADRQLVYANAAHPAFLLQRKSGGSAQLFEAPGNLLGALPELQFDEHAIEVAPGDTLFVYTDGLTDRVNREGEFYAIERIAAMLESSRDSELDVLHRAIDSEVRGFSATEEFKDDIAFVVARFR